MEIILFVFIALNIILACSLLIKKLAKKLNLHTFFQKIAVTTITLLGSLLTMSFSTAPAAKTTILGISPIKNYATDYSQTQIDSLKSIYAQNKELPSGFELQALLALSYYPEFINLPIKFVNKDIKTTMACQPDIKLMLKTGKRAYTIFIDTDKNGEGIELSEVPFNAQVGVIGHELAHIIDYENKNTLQLVGTGFGYLFGSYKHHLEHKVDGITIKKGLGWQLREWADFAMNQSSASEQYKAFKKEIYMNPEEIENLISK
jgi:hypothetical protein